MLDRSRSTRRAFITSAGVSAAVSISGCLGMPESNPLTEKWDVATSRITGAITASDGHVWAPTVDGLSIHDAETGERTGIYSRYNGEVRSQPVVADGIAYFGTYVTEAVVAVDRSGEVVWEQPLDDSVSSCVLTEERVIAATYGSDPGLYALDRGTGDQVWTIPLDEHPVFSSPVGWSSDVYVESGGFAAFDAESGDLEWRNEVSGGEIGGTPRYRPAVDESHVYFPPSQKTGLHAINHQTSAEAWQYEVPNGRLTTPLVHEGIVYVGTAGASQQHESAPFYAINARTGDEEWTVAHGEMHSNGPAIMGDQVLAANLEKLVAYDRETGEQKWAREFDIRNVGHSVADGDRIYVTGRYSEGGRVFAFSVQ